MASGRQPGGRPAAMQDPGGPRSSEAERRCGTVAQIGLHQAGVSCPPDGLEAPPWGRWIGGSDAPERREVRVGFLPLTDCASLVMAAVQGFDKKHGIELVLTRERSWATIRDKLLSAQIDAAQMLYGLVYGIQMGIGGPRRDLAVLMTLSQNGQGITFAKHLKEQGITSGDGLRELCHAGRRRYTLAHTFPTGTHALWLNYWLAAHDIDPLVDVDTITVPPPQIVKSMRQGKMDGACVGEPWNALSIAEGVGFTAANSQDVWPDHPEKALGATLEFVERHPNTARALVMAVLEASRYCDAERNRAKVAEVIAYPAYVGAPLGTIAARLMGEYDNGIGRRWRDAHYMRFHDDGRVNFPYLSDGMWFLTQHRRWGLMRHDPPYARIARQVQRIALYKEAASAVQVPCPEAAMRRSVLMDGRIWDGSDPQAYAQGFPIRWSPRATVAASHLL